MRVDAPLTIDQQITDGYNEYKMVLGKRDEYGGMQRQWHERVSQMPAVQSLIWELFNIGKPKYSLGNGFEQEQRIVELLKKRSGLYDVSWLKAVDSIAGFSLNFSYGFGYVSWENIYLGYLSGEKVSILLQQKNLRQK